MTKVTMLRGKDPREISVERKYACLVVAAKRGDLLAPALMQLMETFYNGTQLRTNRVIQEIIDGYERDRIRGTMADVPESQL